MYNAYVKAFLPLKEHSERVPGKNFRILGTKVLYRWILDTLLSVDEVSSVTIDTDSTNEDLWELAHNAKIKIKRRRPDLIGDFVSMNELIWDFVKEEVNQDFLMTHATNPFLSAQTIQNAILTYEKNKKSGFDSLFAVNLIQGRLFDSSGKPINHEIGELIRTQDLSPIFLENSSIYLFSKKSFSQSHSRIGRKPFLFETPTLEAVDIDTRDDWALAEKLAAALGSQNS